MKLLLLKGYNNYQNRWLKKETSIDAYKNASTEYYDYTTDINFNINDGINTQVTVNLTDNFKKDFMADYVVVYEDNTIKNRWFVLEQVWNRKDQYILTLKRDVLADFHENYKTAPMLIERGYPTTLKNSTELYNGEGVSYSQIKTHQIELGHPELQWIVIYLNKYRTGYQKQDLCVGFGITDDEKREYGNAAFFETVKADSTSQEGWMTYDANYVWIKNATDKFGKKIDNGIDINPSNITDMPEAISTLEPNRGITSDNNYDIIVLPYSKYDGALININYNEQEHYGDISTSTFTPKQIYDAALSIVKTLGADVYDVQLCPFPPGSLYKYPDFYVYPIVNITYEEWDIGKEFPIIDVSIATPPGGTGFYSFEPLEIIKERLNFELHYDDDSNSTLTYKFVSSFYFDTSTLDSRHIGYYAYSSNCKYRQTITYPYSRNNIQNQKIDSECRFLRLCSPNGKAMWEYNITRNGNTSNTETFEILATFKPKAPMFFIRPIEFGGLYKQTYLDDQRGLVDTSSYSLDIVNDSWISYVEQNSNFQTIFNRQIETIELQNKYQKQSDVVGAIGGVAGGVAGGAASGAAAGSIIPGVGTAAGAVVGGLIGGIASAFAGGYDVSINEKLREEQLSLTKDLHYMNLAQIKARPDTLAKVSNVDINSHLCPYIEIYSASEDEIDYLKDLLRYKGYSIQRISTFKKHMDNSGTTAPFISGRLIECPTLQEDAHIYADLNKELQTGVRVFL